MLWYEQIVRTILFTVMVSAGCGFTPGFLAPDASVRGDVPMDEPGIPDRDGDGVVDSQDLCPDDADPMQRDHDGDQHGDVCDGCPHLPSSADPDGDGDRVGDACDPRPTMGGDERVMWFGFYADDAQAIAGWSKTGTWTINDGWLSVADSNSVEVIRPPAIVDRAHLQTSMRIDDYSDPNAAAGTLTGHVADSMGNIVQFYQCALFKSGSVINARSTSEDAELEDDYDPYGGSYANGAIHSITASFGTTFDCTFAPPETTVSSVLGNLAGRVTLLAQRAAVSYDYLFVVEIGQ